MVVAKDVSAEVADTKVQSPKVSSSLPPWAQDATKDDNLAQPWKDKYGTPDHPKFDEGEDSFVLYKNGIKACEAEGTLAA